MVRASDYVSRRSEQVARLTIDGPAVIPLGRYKGSRMKSRPLTTVFRVAIAAGVYGFVEFELMSIRNIRSLHIERQCFSPMNYDLFRIMNIRNGAPIIADTRPAGI